jgi:DnaJ-class molecular chaperone
MRDPYAVLGVARNASDDEIKRAFRRLAKKLHPDVNPGKRAEQQFSELNAANALLSDPAKRKRFDRGEIDAEGRERGFNFGFGQTGAGPRAAPGGGFADFSLDEVFQEFLGRGRRAAGAQPRAKATAVANVTMRLGFLEAALGGKRQMALGDRSVEVAIPAGIDTGQKLRLRDPQAGEVLLEVTVDPHPTFTRKDRDIHVEAPVGLVDAVLGGSITVPTIHGPVTVKVPKGSNSGATLRLKGKGIAAAGASGDQYVKLRIVLPDPPDPELAQFLERWAQRQGTKVPGGN